MRGHTQTRLKRSLLSLSVCAVVLLVVLVAPATAVELSLKVPDGQQNVGETIAIKTAVDLKRGENIPIDNVTVQIKGPGGIQFCTFRVDGTLLSACPHFTVALHDNNADFAETDRYGKGWNGSKNVNTTFGYGYGYGWTKGEHKELSWDITWDSTGAQEGDYHVTHWLSSSAGPVHRLYKLKESKKFKLHGSSGSTNECVAAIKSGKLKGTVNGGTATITNTAGKSFKVGVAVYQKYDENISNQILFDSETGIAKPGTTILKVDVPACAYQIDVFCGAVLPSLKDYPKVQYGDRKIVWKHIGKAYCSNEDDEHEDWDEKDKKESKDEKDVQYTPSTRRN